MRATVGPRHGPAGAESQSRFVPRRLLQHDAIRSLRRTGRECQRRAQERGRIMKRLWTAALGTLMSMTGVCAAQAQATNSRCTPAGISRAARCHEARRLIQA